VIVSVWLNHVDATAAAQFVGGVSEQGGLMRYLALHFLKEAQSPPKGWHGHRVTRSRGYLRQAGWKARAEASASLKLKRAIRAAEQAGYEGAEALALAELAMLRAEQERWECVTIEVSAAGELTGIRPMLGGGIAGPATGLRRLARAAAELRWDAAYAEYARWASPVRVMLEQDRQIALAISTRRE
jgi:hypothetical protein